MKKATSVQNIKDVKDIIFSIEKDLVKMESKLTIVASTDDDIFAFEFEGPDLLQSCKKAGLFAGWEKDQKIRKLEKDNKELEEEYENKLDDIQRKYEHVLREKHGIKEENEKLKEAIQKYHEENKQLKQENKTKCENCLAGASYEEMYRNLRDKLEKENEKLKKELHSLKTLKKSNLPETPITDTMLVDDYLKLAKENEKLIFEKAMIKNELALEKAANEAQHKNPVDNVNHPSHYTGKYECIDVMQDVFGNEATNDFCLCNAFKYIWRARKKNGLEDVKKAVWYLNKYIEEAEKDGEDKVTGA